MPVTPAAHYHMGGVAVDEAGRTSLSGLWACGEVASSGVHGANRLASNSLLEALVFGARVAADLREGQGDGSWTRRRSVRLSRIAPQTVPGLHSTGDEARGEQARRILWENVGLIRDEQGLSRALARLEELGQGLDDPRGHAGNLIAVGRLIAAAALERRESRGGHYRSDYPSADPTWQRRLSLSADQEGRAHFESAEVQALAGLPG